MLRAIPRDVDEADEFVLALGNDPSEAPPTHLTPPVVVGEGMLERLRVQPIQPVVLERRPSRTFHRRSLSEASSRILFAASRRHLHRDLKASIDGVDQYHQGEHQRTPLNQIREGESEGERHHLSIWKTRCFPKQDNRLQVVNWQLFTCCNCAVNVTTPPADAFSALEEGPKLGAGRGAIGSVGAA